MLDPNIQRESIPFAFHEPLIAPCLGVIGGILFADVLPGEWRLAAACAAASALLWFFALHRRARLATWLAGCAALFWLAAARVDYQNAAPFPYLAVDPREVVSLDVCIVSLPERQPDRLLFVAEAAPGARLRISWYDAAPALAYGEAYRLPLRIHAVHNAGNPGSFNAERYLRHREIYWNASVAARYPVVRLDRPCGARVPSLAAAARQHILDRISRLAEGDQYLEAMLGALLIGDNAKLEQAWTQSYRQTGTYHAIVVSGLHVTVLAGTLAWLLRACFLPRGVVFLLSGTLVLAYATACGFAAPVLRAAGGYLLFLLGSFFYRRARILNLLAAVALLFLLADPEQIHEGSFLLSFLAVLTLGALAAPLEDYVLSPWKRALYSLENRNFDALDPRSAELRLELRLASATVATAFGQPVARVQFALRCLLWPLFAGLSLLLTSAVILVGLSLPTVLFFHRLTFSSLTANLPVVALLSAGVVVGFAALWAGPLAAPVAAPLLSAILNASRAIVDWHLSWDAGGRLPDPPLWLCLLLPVCLLATALLVRMRPRWAWLPTLATLACFVLLALPRPPLLAMGQFEVTAVDIGQGDSLFLATPSGHTAILDGGGSRSTRFDPGESILSPYLWSRQIAQVDTLIASHGDADHMGGLLAAYDNFRPREVWVSSQVKGELWPRLRARAGQRIRYLSQGDRLRLGDVAVEVLWPPRSPLIEKSNAGSLVLLLTHGCHRFLLTGDIENGVERELVASGRLPKIDLLKVAHHGSKSSTSEAFLAATRPSFALVSAGFANSFGHPHPSVTQRLREFRSQVLRTDQLGQVRVLSDGRKLQVEPHLYRAPHAWGWIPLGTAVE